MRFFIINMGCAKNLVESERLTETLTLSGYTIVHDIGKAELIIINTCGFIKEAKEESINTILKTLQEKPKKAYVVVFGCLVHRYLEELKTSIPEVELFLPVMPAKDIAEAIKNHFPPGKAKTKTLQKFFFTPPVYKYLKVADGCKNYCSYCVIPLIRGDLRSRDLEDILKEAKEAINNGVIELNIIGQDITAYGEDIYGRPKLIELVKSLLQIDKYFWVRLLYLYPTRIPDEIFHIMNSDKRLLPYLDIPIQHADDRILKLMNRDYKKAELIKTIDEIRNKVPQIVLRTSLIAGFSTESEEDFENLLAFVKKIKFDHLGVFTYSPEEDTVAFNLKPRIPVSTRRKRKRILMKEQYKIVQEKLKSLKNIVLQCLVEEPLDELGAVWVGRFYGQAPEVDGVVYITDYEPSMGKLVSVKIIDYKDYDLIGKAFK